MKRFLIIVLILIILAGAGFLAWRYLRPVIVTPTPETSPPVNHGGGSTITVLSSEPIFDYWTSASGEIYYLAVTGQIYKLDERGSETKLASQAIPDLDSVRASFNGAALVVAFGAGPNKTFSLFRVADATWEPLPEDVTAVSWDPERPRLAYFKDTGSASILYLLDLTNGRTTEVIRLAQKDLGLEWLTPEEIYLTQKPSARFAGSLWSLNLRSKSLRLIVREENGLMIRWGDRGKLGLKSTTAGRDIHLSLINNNNQSLRPVRLPPTLTSKCVFEGEIIYCAVPASIPSAAVLPDDYLKDRVYFSDGFRSWDTATGTVTAIPINQSAPVDAEKLTKLQNKLLFINRYDRKLYSLGIGN